MSSRLKTASKPAPSTPSERQGVGFVVGLKIWARRFRRGFRVLFPQWLRTTIVAALWLGAMAYWVSLTSVYASYGSAYLAGIGMVLFGAIGGHLWPTRTPPWRTLAWASLLTIWTGSTLLLAGAGQYALTGATILGIVFIVARVNQNARRIYRAAKLKPIAAK